MKARKKTVSDEILQEIVRRIVEVAKPEKIILFGSAAREEMGPDSDLDFLVIKSCKNRRKTARKIRRRLNRDWHPKDIIVATPEDIERYKDTIGLIYRPALKEGKSALCRLNGAQKARLKSGCERAKGNLALAKQRKPKEAYWEDLCFEAEQAVEKAIKAVLRSRGIDFPKTHDIGELLALLDRSGQKISQGPLEGR